MIESVIVMLIYLCLLAIAVYLIIWVLEQLGISLPPQVMKILWVIVILVVVLMVVRTILPAVGIRIGDSPLTKSVVVLTDSKCITMGIPCYTERNLQLKEPKIRSIC